MRVVWISALGHLAPKQAPCKLVAWTPYHCWRGTSCCKARGARLDCEGVLLVLDERVEFADLGGYGRREV